MKVTRATTRGFGTLLVAACLAACAARTPVPESAAQAVNDIAQRYYDWALETAPELAYRYGIALERHDGMHDNSLRALARSQAFEDSLFAEINAIDGAWLAGTPEWVTWVLLRQKLASQIALRVCRQELWAVNQMGGWHLSYPQIATRQPVATPELREQALARWSAYPRYVQQEIDNLKLGVAAGFTAPKTVVRRVISQVDGVLALAIEDSPFYSMAKRADDVEFAAELSELVETGIYPALRAYRTYLEERYLPAARQALSVAVNPDGAACYEASLRSYTTLDRRGLEVFELGQETVAANRRRVVELGEAVYGIRDFSAILAAVRDDPADHFSDPEELLAFSRDTVRQAEAVMPQWVARMPAQSAAVVPFPEHEEGTGRSARYEPAKDGQPGRYRIPLYQAETKSRGNAEITAFHEVWPGHHLQVATAASGPERHPVTRLIWFSGPGEGWARYAEALAEEMGLYTTTSGPILRRSWPARGMVVDPGIHVLGWSREEAADFIMESGRFSPEEADTMVDRIAILPGQLTAYDSGALEIFALRREAEALLGNDFDIREFHDRVLEHGTIPLSDLRHHIEAWLVTQVSVQAAE